MELFAFVNDSLVPLREAALGIGDLAIQRGYGVFDFFRTRAGLPIFLDEHLDRFFSSAAGLGLHVGRGRDELKAMIGELLRKNGVGDSGVKLTLTGGYSEDGYSLGQRANLIISQQPLTLATAAEPVKSLHLITYPHMRQLPEIKTIDYLMAIRLQPLLREKGVDDVLYHWDGVIAECPRSNFFVVTADGTLVTPGTEVLRGITRMKVLELAKGKLATEERDVSLDELKGAKEAFVTSTTRQVMPVTAIDGMMVGNGDIGPVTKMISRDLFAHGAVHRGQKWV